jgi:hypothetical protein
LKYIKKKLSYFRWKFGRGLVFDGNFSAEQLRMKRPLDDVHLTDGSGFLVPEGPYQEHLKVAIEIKEVSTFHISNPIPHLITVGRNKPVMNIPQ